MAALPDDESASVVVVGTGLAGVRAAETLRAEGLRGRITMVGDEPGRPYDRPPLSKQYLAGTWGADRIQLRPDDKLDALALDWRLGVRAVALDVPGRTVHLDDGTSVPYDGLVVATGAWPRTFAGALGVPGVHVLRRRSDADNLAAALGRHGDVGRAGSDPGSSDGSVPAAGRNLVVIGAGFIGTEVAATARGLGAAVTVLDPVPVPLGRALGDVVGGACGELHLQHGVDLRTGVAATALVTAAGDQLPLGGLVDAWRPRSAPAADPGVVPVASTAADGTGTGVGPGTRPVAGTGPPAVAGVALADGQVLPADAVLVAVGVTPDVGWLAAADLTLDDGVVVTPTLHAAPSVVAAGDLARWTDAAGTAVRIEHWTNAAEQGVVAARSLLAGEGAASPYDPVPYVWSDQYDVKIQVIGLPAATDDVAVVEGSLSSQRFVAAYSRQGRLTGAVGFGRPRQLMGLRPLLLEGATVGDARRLFAVG